MKSLLAILGLSLIANLVLLLQAQMVKPTHSAAVAQSAPSSATPPRLDEAFWEKAVAGDFTALQAIRDSGLPMAWVHALIRAAIIEQFRARESALYPSRAELKYWFSNYPIAFFRPKDRVALLDLRRERERLLDQWTPGWRENEIGLDSPRSFLSADKARQIELIDEDFAALTGDLRQNLFGGILLPAEREKLRFLDQEQRKEISQLLSPAEFDEYQVQVKSYGLSFKLAAFHPTEQEFREIYKIQSTVVERVFSSEFESRSPESQAARANAQEEADRQIKALLGEQRFADYTRSQDQEYRTFAEISERLELPKDRAVEAYKLKTSLEEKLSVGMREANVERRTQHLAQVTEEADREFTRLLGTKGYDVYKQYGNLPRMMKSVLSRPSPPPKG